MLHSAHKYNSAIHRQRVCNPNMNLLYFLIFFYSVLTLFSTPTNCDKRYDVALGLLLLWQNHDSEWQLPGIKDLVVDLRTDPNRLAHTLVPPSCPNSSFSQLFTGLELSKKCLLRFWEVIYKRNLSLSIL